MGSETWQPVAKFETSLYMYNYDAYVYMAVITRPQRVGHTNEDYALLFVDCVHTKSSLVCQEVDKVNYHSAKTVTEMIRLLTSFFDNQLYCDLSDVGYDSIDILRNVAFLNQCYNETLLSTCYS